MDDRGLISGRSKTLSSLHNIRTKFGAYPAICPVCTVGFLFSEVYLSGYEAVHWPASSAKIKNSGVISSLPRSP
jgi:hypothetical protein